MREGGVGGDRGGGGRCHMVRGPEVEPGVEAVGAEVTGSVCVCGGGAWDRSRWYWGHVRFWVCYLGSDLGYGLICICSRLIAWIDKSFS